MHVVLACIAATLAADPEAIDRYAAKAGQRLVDNETVVGLSIGTFDRGRTHVAGFGKLDADRTDAPDGRTVYELASLTKIFTGILLADTVERGELKLDDPANQYLPEHLALPKSEARPITLADIATHHSGLPRMPDNFSPADWSNPYLDYTEQNLAEFLAGHKLRRAPGAEYEYSNLAYGILGQILARKTGQPFKALVKERICLPLGMKETTIALSDDAKIRLAAPYDEKLKPAANWDMPLFLGGGALRSTVDDMLLFIAANVDTAPTIAGSISGGPRIPTLAAAIKASQQPHADTNIGPDVKMGLGWHMNTKAGTYFHSGQTGGYHTFIGCHPAKRVGVIVLSNTATDKVDDVGVKILARLVKAAGSEN